MTRTASQNATITFTSLAGRAAGATADFVIGGNASAANGIVIGGQSTGFMGAGMFYGNGTGTSSSYAWYDSGGFVRGINYTGDTGAATSGAATTLSSTLYQQITGNITAQDNATFTTFQIKGNNNLTLNGTGHSGIQRC